MVSPLSNRMSRMSRIGKKREKTLQKPQPLKLSTGFAEWSTTVGVWSMWRCTFSVPEIEDIHARMGDTITTSFADVGASM